MAKIREETDVKPWKPRGTDRRTRVLMAEYVDSGFLIGRETSRLISASPTCFRFAKIVSVLNANTFFGSARGTTTAPVARTHPPHLPHAPSPTCSAPPPSSPSSSRSSRARRPCPRTSLARITLQQPTAIASMLWPRPPPLAAPCALLLRMISPRRARGTVAVEPAARAARLISPKRHG